MPLELASPTESEYEQLVLIFNDAFQKDPMVDILFPDGHNSQTIAQMVEEYREARKDPTCCYTGVTETETGEIIAWARWNFYSQERPESEWNKPFERDDNGTAKANCTNEIFGKLTEHKKRIWQGQPFYCLDMLVTATKHQNRGAGNMLLEWGARRADQDGMPIYVEGSPVAYNLYKKHGFEQVGEVLMNYEDYEAKGQERITLMVRQPQTKNHDLDARGATLN